jgi:hypothetical protein
MNRQIRNIDLPDEKDHPDDEPKIG